MHRKINKQPLKPQTSKSTQIIYEKSLTD